MQRNIQNSVRHPRYYQHPNAEQPLQVLTPKINQIHKASKVVGLDMVGPFIHNLAQTTDEYYFYEPILGKKRKAQKAEPASQRDSHHQHHKETTPNQASYGHHLAVTPRQFGSSQGKGQHSNKSVDTLIDKQSFGTAQENQQKGRCTNQQKLEDFSKKKIELFRPVHNQDGRENRLVNSRGSVPLNQNVLHLQSNFINYENNKQNSNNPLKDISNSISSAEKHRMSMPFEIAPLTTAKVNNYFKIPLPKAQMVNPAQIHPQQMMTTRNQPERLSPAIGNGHFEKKRLSDTQRHDDLFKLADEVVTTILDKKERQRKHHNASVTTNTSTNSVSTSKTNASNYYSNNQKKAQATSQQSSKQIESAQTNSFNVLMAHEKYIFNVLEMMKRKQKLNINLKELEKRIREVKTFFKKTTTDPTLLYLIKLHSRAEFMAFAFLTIIGQESKTDCFSSQSDTALHYTHQNIKVFMDLVSQTKNHGLKKDSAHNPFGVNGQGYKGKENSTNSKASNSKSEKKMLIKQNTHITLAFLKKICRMNNTDKFKELLIIVNRIEGGQNTVKVKDQIKRALHHIKMDLQSGSSLNVPVDLNTPNEPPKTCREHKPIPQNEELSIPVDKENMPPQPESGRLSLQPTVRPENLLLSIAPKKSTQTRKHDVIQVNVRKVSRQKQLASDSESSKEERDDTVNSIAAPASINPRSSSLPSREIYLPPIADHYEYTLVLDLDETLVHFDQKKRQFRVRPCALKFLREMAKYYEVVIFTAALQDYADWIINAMDNEKSVAHRLYRDHTRCRNGIYLKDLSLLGRDLSKTIIIDNIEENFSAQPENGINIKSWYSDPYDRELDKMIPFLRSIVAGRAMDIRPLLRIFNQQHSREHFHSGPMR